MLKWGISSDAYVTINVCDAGGRKLIELLNSVISTKGFQQQEIDVSQLTAGIYFVVLEINAVKQVKKLVIQK